MNERGNNIKVFVRVRPLSELESQVEGNSRCIEQLDDRSLRVTNFEGTASSPYLSFAFDRVFAEQTEQETVYSTVAEDIVKASFEGINGTIFCYGQTASGKTYTCVGPELSGGKRGLLPRIIEAVMERVRIRPSNIDLRAKVSLVEIYNEKVTDLLDLTRRNLKLRENRNKGVFIEHVTERYISRTEEGYQLLAYGLENRSVGCTQMNAVSSRSHMLFMISLVSNDFSTGEAKSARLTVIDLAGSEKISKTGTEGKQLSEAIKINTSLSALGNVIHSLSEGKGGHVPYRDSKLTRLLQ
jgi:kinesin family protein 5